MIVKPPFKKTLLGILISGMAFGVLEASAAQCTTTTDSEGNVTTASGVCDGYQNDSNPVEGNFTNVSTIEIPSMQAAGIGFSSSYVDNLFNLDSITGTGQQDSGIYINNSSFSSIDNQGDITNTEKGINVNQDHVDSGTIINRANIGSYGDGISLNISNNSESGSITNEGVIQTSGDVPDSVDVDSAIGISVHNTDNSVFADISNTGEISAFDSGIALDTSDNSVSGNITNSGTIDSESQHGIQVSTADNSKSGNVVNEESGAISAADSAIKMSVDDYSTGGNIVNNGSMNGNENGIDVTVSANSSIGSINNASTGTINVNEEQGAEDTLRSGIKVSVTNNGSVGDITNEGTISAPDYGMKIDGSTQSSIGQVTNTGSIDSTDYQGVNISLSLQSTLSGFSNSGNISSVWRTVDIDAESGSTVGDIINTGSLTSNQQQNSPGGPGSGSENIYVTGHESTFNDVINTGTLKAQRDDAIEVNLYDESSMGDVINTGDITAYFDGLDVDIEDGSSAGNVINTGAITASNDGIEVDALENSSVERVENSGTITGIASEGGIADGISIDVEENSSIGTVINTGSINIINNDIMEFDVDEGSRIDNIINTGSLSFNPDGVQFSSAFNGIEVEADYQGDADTVNHIGEILNTGSISASGRGIEVELDDNSVLDRVINTGSLSSSHTGIEVDARGNDEVTDMTVFNSGSVVSNYYDGISMYGTLKGDVENTGTVTGQLHGVSLYSNPRDVSEDSDQDLTVNLTNSGTIVGNSGNGVYVASNVKGSINNSGTISSQSSGDMFADYGVNTNMDDYTQVGDYSTSQGNVTQNMKLYHLAGTNWYVLEKSKEGSSQTLRRFFQSNGGVDEVSAFIETGNYNYDNENKFRPHDEYTLAFDQVFDGDSGSLTEYVSQPIVLSSVRDNGNYETAMPRFSNGSAIKITKSFDGDIINTGILASRAGSTLHVTGSLDGSLKNSGTIIGGTLGTLPEGSVQWPEGSDADAPFEIDGDYSDMLDHGYFPGMSLPESGDAGPQQGDTVAIDFSASQSALKMEQTGDSASVTGDIWGQVENPEPEDGEDTRDSIVFGDASTGTGGGSVTGNIYGVENITVTGGNFTLTGNSYEQGGQSNTFTVASSGTMTLGTNTGTQIDGTYNQSGGLVVPVGDANSALNNEEPLAALNVGGDASISGTMTVNPVWSEFEYSRNAIEKYHVVNAGSMDYTGSLANQTVLFTQSISEENGTDLYLDMNSNDLETEVENASGNSLYGQLADDLQSALVTQGTDSDLFQALLGVADGQELSEVIENAVTGKDGSEALLAEALQDGVFNNILTRLAESRSGVGGVSFGEELPWHGGVWLKALMVKANQSRQTHNSETFNGYNSKTKGFTLGYDQELNNQWTVGMAWSYADSKMDVKSSSNETSSKSYQLSVYGNWQSGDWFVDSIVNMGLNKNDSSRITDSSVNYKADFDSRQYGVRIVAGKEFWFNDKDTLLEPQLILNYGHLSTDKYREKAGGYSDITVTSSDYQVMELGSGVRFSHMFELENSMLLPEVSLKGYYDFKGDSMSQEVNVNILNTSLNYRTGGLEAQRMTWQAGTGLSWWLDNNVTLSMNYDRTWRSGFSADSIQAKVRYDF